MFLAESSAGYMTLRTRGLTADHMKDGLIARLAAQVSEFYDQALQAGMTSVNIPSDWINHITAKKLHFYSAAQYRKSIDAVSGTGGSNYGEEVARLQEALRNVNKALERKNFLGRGVRDDLLGLQSMLQRDTERAEKDNDLIYLCTLPVTIYPHSSSRPTILLFTSHRKSTHGQTPPAHRTLYTLTYHTLPFFNLVRSPPIHSPIQ